MCRFGNSRMFACAFALALGVLVGAAPARAQGVAPSNPNPNPWAGYAANRAAPWNAYAARPSAWSNYVYRGSASSTLGASSAPDLAPRKIAYGYYFNTTNSHWEHPGYGGKIPTYGHAARYTELPRPWVWWGSRYY